MTSELETSFRFKDTNRLEIRGHKMIYHENNNQKRAEVTIVKPDKIDFKTKILIKTKKKKRFIMI